MKNPTLIFGLRDQIATQIKRDYWAGKITHGQVIREQRIAEQYEVSRGPVRDALLQLTKEGLLIAEPNRGVRVRDRLDPRTRSLMVRMRRTIEQHALHRAFPASDAPVLKQLTANIDEFRSACRKEDYPTVVELDMAFHRTIVCLGSQDDLELVWLPIMIQLTLPYSRHHTLLESYEEHRAILDAIIDGRKSDTLLLLKQNIR